MIKLDTPATASEGARVTCFFREPEVFDALQRLVLPRLLERRPPDVPLRIWVPGCASGEEAYGLAIIVLEHFAALQRPAPPVKIYATDICAAAIDRARAGSYPESIAREVSPQRLAAFFVHEGSSYRVNARVRSVCVFGTHDLTSDSPLLHMDLISCRNLLVHLDSQLRSRVTALLHHALRAPGFLLLGNAETVEGVPGLVAVGGHPIYERTSTPRPRNEERQIAKEELLAANEELRTLNSEMSSLNAEAARLTDDLTNVLACSGVPLILVNREGVIRRLTPAALEAFGATALDLGHPVASVAAIAEVFPDVEERIAEVVEHLTPFTGTIWSPAERWFQCTIRPYVQGDRQVDGVVITAHDIHEVRRTAEELDEARRHAESVLDTVHGALIVVGPGLAVRSVNRRFVELFGLSPREVERKRMDALGVEVLAAPVLIAMIQTLDAAHPAADLGLVQRDRELGRRSFHANARRIEGTELTLVAIEDVTAREEAQLAVRRAELGFREMLMAAGEAIIMTDPDRRPFFANRAAGELFGYASDEMLEGTLDRLLPALDVTRFAAGPAPPSSPRPDVVGRRRDGSEFLAQVVVSHAVREQQPAIVVFVTDVTRERESQKKLHEFQEMLQRKAFDAALAEEHERRRLAVALHDGVGQSLALAKMKLASAGDGATNPERSNIDQVSRILEEAIAETRALTFDLSTPVLYDLGLKAAAQWLADHFAQKYGLEVELVQDGADLPLDEVTSSVLFRSIRELLMNVVKHADVKEARISFSRKGDQLIVEIADGGVGFEAATDRITESAGFGLLSIRQQVTGLGGVVAVDSEPGRGARVTLQVPLRRPDEADGAARATEPS